MADPHAQIDLWTHTDIDMIDTWKYKAVQKSKTLSKHISSLCGQNFFLLIILDSRASSDSPAQRGSSADSDYNPADQSDSDPGSDMSEYSSLNYKYI